MNQTINSKVTQIKSDKVEEAADMASEGEESERRRRMRDKEAEAGGGQEGAAGKVRALATKGRAEESLLRSENEFSNS